MKEENVYDKAQRLVIDFERKYPSIATRMNKDQLLAAALMSAFTQGLKVS